MAITSISFSDEEKKRLHTLRNQISLERGKNLTVSFLIREAIRQVFPPCNSSINGEKDNERN